MLFTPEATRRQRVEIAQRFHDGALTELEAGRRLTEVDPDFGGGYLLLGNGNSEAGDLIVAESCYWQALHRMPCDYGPYMALSEARLKRAGNDSFAQRMMLLAIWKLAFCGEIPDHIARFFGSRMKIPDLDFKAPATYEALASLLEREVETSGECEERLRPFELLNEIQRQAAGGLDAELVRDLLAQSERLVPLWRAALREWAEARSKLSPDVVGLLIALAGETAGPEIVEDLVELIATGDADSIFLHANWALWRVGQRFPAQTLDQLRKAAAEAHLSLRCALADQVELLPETPGIETALAALLDGFADLARENDAPYLLAIVMQTLKKSGYADAARRYFQELHHLLPEEAAEWVREKFEEGLVSVLSGEEIAGITIEEICSDRILMEDDEEEDEYEEEDEDEFEVITPIVAPVRPGRNDPCWCGSGKKYKKCHLAADEASERPQEPGDSAGEPLYEKLHRELAEISTKWRSNADFTEASLLFWGRRPEELDTQLQSELLHAFFEWYLYEFRPAATGRTLVEEYLRRRAGRLAAAERELLEAWRDARFGIWEVQRIEEGTGVELRDLLAGDQFFVHDVSCSRSVVRWDCLLGRIYRSQGRWRLAGILLTVPRPLLPQLRERIERESRESGQDAAAYVRANSHRWPRLVEELAEERLAGLRVVNAEGDDLEFGTAYYRIEQEAPVVAALEAAGPFEPEEEDTAGVRSFAWLEQGTEGPRRAYGHIQLRDGKLRLECNSRKRLETGRRLIEEHCGAWLRHLGDSFKSFDAVKKRVRDRNAPRTEAPAPALPPEVEREILGKMKREHYAKWVDERLPALGGQTPREAARTEEGRRDLEELLRQMENGEERARREGRVAFDLSIVRKELGM